MNIYTTAHTDEPICPDFDKKLEIIQKTEDFRDLIDAYTYICNCISRYEGFVDGLNAAMQDRLNEFQSSSMRKNLEEHPELGEGYTGIYCAEEQKNIFNLNDNKQKHINHLSAAKEGLYKKAENAFKLRFRYLINRSNAEEFGKIEPEDSPYQNVVKSLNEPLKDDPDTYENSSDYSEEDIDDYDDYDDFDEDGVDMIALNERLKREEEEEDREDEERYARLKEATKKALGFKTDEEYETWRETGYLD